MRAVRRSWGAAHCPQREQGTQEDRFPAIQAQEPNMAGKRELIEPHAGDKRYVRRDDKGRFKESDDVGRSLAQDVRKHARTEVKSGQGDRGDRRR